MSDTTGNAPDFAAGRRTDSLCNPAPVPAVSPPTEERSPGIYCGRCGYRIGGADLVFHGLRNRSIECPRCERASGETGTGEGHAERLERMEQSWRVREDNAALRAGAEAIRENVRLRKELDRLYEWPGMAMEVRRLEKKLFPEDSELRDKNAGLRERVRVLEVFLNEYAAHHERCNRVPCDCGFDEARAALAPPADREEDA